MIQTPLKTFIIYARNDKAHKDELLSHLKPLVAAQMLDLWHDGDMNPGEEWEVSIKKNLKASEIILVLVTKHCLNSDFIQTEELQSALLKMNEGSAHILPIIVSPCMWKLVPIFNNLQCLPEDAKPITTWLNKDEAWTNVAEGILKIAEHIHVEKAKIAAKKEAEIAQKEAVRLEKERLEKLSLEQKEKERLAKIAAEKQAEKERLERLAFEEKEREHLAILAAEKAEKEHLERLAFEEKEKERLAEIEAENISTAPVVSPDQQEQYQASKMQTKDGSLLLFFHKYKIYTLSSLIIILAIFFIPKLLPKKIDTTADPKTLVINTDSLRQVAEKHKQDSLVHIAETAKKDFFKIDTTPKNIAKPIKLQPTKTDAKDKSTESKSLKPEYTETVKGISFVMKFVSYIDDDFSFYISETEVTQALWQAVMGSNPSKFIGSNLPVETVSWNDAQNFIKKLNQLTGKNYCLPSSSQWLYTVKGGEKSKGYTYAGSNNINEVAWYNGNSGGITHRVGSKKPNELGIYDMSGNVQEWCVNDSYPDRERNSHPVVRNGGWSDEAIFCTCKNTSSAFSMDNPDSKTGIRICFEITNRRTIK